jgi:hypothetical protein
MKNGKKRGVEHREIGFRTLFMGKMSMHFKVQSTVDICRRKYKTKKWNADKI